LIEGVYSQRGVYDSCDCIDEYGEGNLVTHENQ